MIAGRLEIEIASGIARLQQDMAQARGAVTNFARDAERALSGLRTAFGALGIGLSGGALLLFAKRAIDAADAVEEMSQKTGIGIRALSELRYAAEREGVALDALGKGVKDLSRRMVEAGDASSRSGKLMAAMGVDVSRGVEPALAKIADTFAGMSDGATKSALAVELFGKAGMDMIPLLNQGSDGIAKLREEAVRLGVVFDEDAARAASEFKDNLHAVQASAESLGVTIANTLLPTLSEITRAMKLAAEDGGLLQAIWVGMGGAAHAVGEKLGLIKDPLQELYGELERLREHENLIERALGLGRAGHVQAEIREIERQIASLLRTAGGNSGAAGAGAGASGTFSTAGSVLGRLLGGGKEDGAAAREAQRLREQDVRGWVAYIDTITKEYEDGLLAQGRALDEWRAHEQRMRQLSDADWVKKIDAEIAEYERGLTEMASRQPSHLQAMQMQWLTMWGQVSDVAGDFFADLVLNGKSAFDNLKKWVKELLAQMIALFAKRWVLNMAAGGSVWGSAGQALAGGGSDGSMAGNVISSGASLMGAGSSLGLGGASVGASMWGAMGAGTVATETGVVLATGSMAGTSVGTGVMGGIYSTLASIPVWGWIAMAVIAIGAWIAGSHKGGDKIGGSFFGGGAVPGTDNGRFFTPNQGDEQMRAMVNATSQGYTDAITRLGGTAGAFNFGLGFDHDPRGTARSRVSSLLTDAAGNRIYGVSDVEMDDKEVDAALGLEMQRMILAALQASDLHPELNAFFESIGDVANLTGEQINAIIAQAMELKAVIDVLALWDNGLTVQAIRDMTRTGETLGQTLNAVAQAQQTYYELFYTEAENLARNTEILRRQFEAMGLQMPLTREAFRALVEGLDLTTASGAQLYRWLLEMAPAFAAVVQPVEDVVDVVEDAGDAFTEFGGTISGVIVDIFNGWYAGAPARRRIGEYLAGSLSGPMSPLDPMGRFGAAQQDYQRTLGLAQGGDIDAMMRLPGARDAMLQLARDIWGSSSAFVSLFEQSFNELAGVGEVDDYNTRMLGLQTDGVQYQAQMADTLRNVHAVLIEIRDRPPAESSSDRWVAR